MWCTTWCFLCCSGGCIECHVSVNVGENEGSEPWGEWLVRHYSIWKTMLSAPHTFPPWGEWQVRHYSIWKTMLSAPHTLGEWHINMIKLDVAK